MPITRLYAEGVFTAEGEELLDEASRDKDELFLDKVMADWTWAGGFYAKRHDYFTRMAKWFFGEHYEEPPISDENKTGVNANAGSVGGNFQNEHLVTMQLPFTSVVRAHTMMTNEFPAFEALNKTDSPRRESNLENFLYGVHYLNKERWGNYPMDDAIFNQLLFGWGCVRVTWQRGEWDDPDEDFEGDTPLYNFPLEVVSINPDEIFPIPGGRMEKWRAVIHRTQRRVFEVNEEWGVELFTNDDDAIERVTQIQKGANMEVYEPLNPDQVVDVVDYWGWHENTVIHAVVAHNQFVLRPSVMKFYDQLPFVIFFCIDTTDHSNGHRFGLSANHALVDSVAEAEWLTNRHMRIIDQYAEPVKIVVRVNDDPIVANFEPGEKIELVEGEQAYYLQFQGTIPDVRVLEDLFLNLAQEDAFTIPRDGTSGLDTLALQQAGMVKIFKPVENAEKAYEQVNSRIIGLLQRFSWDEKIRVYGRVEGDENTSVVSAALSGRETRGLRQTKVRIRAKFPLEELRNVAAASVLKNSRMMPLDLIQKRFLNIQNTTASQQAILEEDIRDHPAMREALLQLKMQSIVAQSDVMKQVQEEAGRIANRGEISQRGSPEAPAPLGGEVPLETQEAGLEGGLATGTPDNPFTNFQQQAGGPPIV